MSLVCIKKNIRGARELSCQEMWLPGRCQEHLTSESGICPWLSSSQWKLKGHHSPYDVASTPLSFLRCFNTSLWQREWVRCWRTEMVFQAICQQALNNNGICLLTNWAIEFRHWAGHLCDFSHPQLVNHLKTQKYYGQSQNSFPHVVAQHTNHTATRPSPTVTSISRSIYQFNSFIFLITKLLSLWACAERLWLLIKMELY